MIDNPCAVHMVALLNAVEELANHNDPVHTEARDWIKRCRELISRQEELYQKQRELLDAADAAAAEYNKVTAELLAKIGRQQSVLASLRTSTETLQ